MVRDNAAPLHLISNGVDIWQQNSHNEVIQAFKSLYKYQYAALPTNTQFGKRGVKESGYVSLGRRNEMQRTILAIARGKCLPDALAKGRAEIQSLNVKQLQGKKKTKVLMGEFIEHEKRINTLCKCKQTDGIDIIGVKKKIKKKLTKPSIQFKYERINDKVEKVIAHLNDNPAPNVYERRTGQTLTPLLDGRIQIGKLKKVHNMDAIRNELTARGMGERFNAATNWTNLLKLLKEHEKDNKYFRPLTDYDAFKWNATHFGEDGEVIH